MRSKPVDIHEAVTLTIQSTADLERRFEALVQSTGQSLSFHAERAIIESLGDLEDYHAAEQEIEEVRTGRSVPVPLNELLKSP